ncbi:polygalacturonase inhibitor 1-like protein [Carex littledalei]|uniref:Polygalacturonase inhibitor 1-like protein n=1 Tax=Carex littledalei TaxID=544730 RepID=A0A833VB77_9POAL|nr:polygalacturonase inhibitor 1-like protein [Carex littledalei]
MSPIFFLTLYLLSFTSSVLSTKDDEVVLLKIKKQLGNPDGLRWWVIGFDYCDALANVALENSYITCTSTGRVRSLTLQNLVITTSFPKAICGLTEIQDLYLDHNPGFHGPIPSCITKLPNLRLLIITGTSLSGSVPSFYNHANIIGINLARNQLSGTIPRSLSTCPNLNGLELSSNYLTGTVPPGLVHGSRPSLVLNNNNLTGEIPESYGSVDFQLIVVGNNQLIGDVPFLFGKQKNTVNIELNNNDFEFDLSQVEFSDFIYGFDLSHNKIYGKVPESFAKAAGLFFPNLSFNKLCGELPEGDNMGRFDAAVFSDNACLCGYPLLPCSVSPPAPAPAPVSGPPF